MGKEERDKQTVSQDTSDAAEAKPTGELSEQDLAKVDGGGGILDGLTSAQQLSEKRVRSIWDAPMPVSGR